MAENAELRADLIRLRRELERLMVETEVLREVAEPLIYRAPAHERFVFIHRLRSRIPVKCLCGISVTDRSNYYLWTRAQARRDALEFEERGLIELIEEIDTAYPAHGAERITPDLKCQGFELGRRRIQRLMRERGVAGDHAVQATEFCEAR